MIIPFSSHYRTSRWPFSIIIKAGGKMFWTNN